MRFLNTLFAILALLAVTEAFYPYFPAYRCKEDGQCDDQSNSARSVEDGVVTLKLSQRVPNIGLTREEQIDRSINKLARKYRTPSRVHGVTENELLKRTNSHAVKTAATPSQTFSAGIDQDGTDFSYFAEVQLGSANTPVYMLLDTGASTSWIMGPDCDTNACETHDSFGAVDSTTFKETTKTFYVGYGSGNVSGVLATDSLSIAGMTFEMTFGIANNTSRDFENFPIDGILGLSLTKDDNPTFIETLVTSKNLKSNIFGISLSRSSDGPNTGEINFGAPDTSKFTGGLKYESVSENSAGDWAVPLGDVGFGDTKAGITGKLAYIDTGTSFIFAPADQAAAFYKVVPGSKIQSSGSTVTYSVPCDTTTALTFTFGSTTYSVMAKDWISSPSNGVCTGNVFGHAVVPDAWLLGDTFLKNVYAVFDIDQTRVGFAQAVAPVVSSSSIASATSVTSSITSGTSESAVSSGSAPQSAPASITGSSQPSSTAASPGLSGHETNGVGTSAAETTGPGPSPTPEIKKSFAIRFNPNLFGLALPAMAIVLL